MRYVAGYVSVNMFTNTVGSRNAQQMTPLPRTYYRLAEFVVAEIAHRYSDKTVKKIEEKAKLSLFIIKITDSYFPLYLSMRPWLSHFGPFTYCVNAVHDNVSSFKLTID